MSMYRDIESLSKYIRDDRFKVKDSLLVYAFNATGKTRLAESFDDKEGEGIESIIYSAHFEDIFIWDNINNEMRLEHDSYWLLKLIYDEGLEDNIATVFKRHTFSRIEPLFDFEKNTIRFRLATGDSDSENTDNIKVSRGEESLLVWSTFYTVLSHAVDLLQEKKEDRSSTSFDRLKYVVIDDPVSSMDDTRLIGVAMDVADISKRLLQLDHGAKVLTLTHHSLFFNIVHGIMNKKREGERKTKFESYLLSRHNDELKIEPQGATPFAYHLFALGVIRHAIETDSIERYHFNMLRALLEKTANFLGYKSWDKCLENIAEDEFIKLINQYSHGSRSDMESRALPAAETEKFKSAFDRFIKEYNWSNDV